MPEYSPDLLSKDERSMYDMLSPEERQQFDAENCRLVEDYNDPEKRTAAFAEVRELAQQVDRQEPLRFYDEPGKGLGFWAEDEPDEFSLVEDGDEAFNDDEITSMAHAEVELHREVREYARIAAWDMPLLSSKFSPLFPISPLRAIFPANLQQTSQSPSPSHRKPTSFASATQPTWANSTPPNPKSSWNSPPQT